MGKENYYLLLELNFDPPEEDVRVINAAISARQEQWSRERVHPTKGIRAQQYLGMIADITRVMSNPEERKKEALQAQKTAYVGLDEAIKIISRKEYVETVEIEKLAKKFKFPVEVVKKRIPVEIRESKKETGKVEALDSSTTRKIESLLAIVKQENLYDFLGLAKETSCQAIRERARQVESESRKKVKDAFNTASSELAGLCATILGDENKRNQYDEYFKLQALSDVKDKIDIVASSSGEINRAIAVEFIKLAMERDLSYEDAVKFLKSYCIQKRYFIDLPREDDGDATRSLLKRCGICGLVVDISGGADRCTSCGMALVLACPKCSTENDSSNRACLKCGFMIRDMSKAKRACLEAREHLAKMEFEQTKDAISRAEMYWPGYEETTVLAAELTEKRDLAESHITRIRDSVKKGCYQGAYAELKKLKQKMPLFSTPELESKIDYAIKTAETWVRKAKASSVEKEIIEYCVKALDVCGDYIEAKKILAAYPPLPPTKLQLTLENNQHVLKWTRSSSEGPVSYRIIRKEKTMPLNENDGVCLGEVSHDYFVDSTFAAGVPLYYAVFAIRGGVASAPLSTTGPVISYLEVSGLAVMAGNNNVNATWEVQEIVKEVEVWRKESVPPGKRGDGVKVAGAGRTGLRDIGLKNDITYGYLVISVYETESGPFYTGGVAFKCIPTAPPDAVRGASLTKESDGSFAIKWSRVARGEVNIYYTQTPLSDKAGDLRPFAEIEKQLRILPLIEKSETSARFKLAQEGVFYVYPVNSAGGLGVIGEQLRVASVGDFQNVKYTINNRKLYLEFTWPDRASKALILYKYNDYAVDPQDQNANREVVSLAKYSSQAGTIINNIERKNCYITIFAVYGDDINPVYSSGVKLLVKNERIKEIKYSIKAEKSLLGKTKGICLEIISDGALSGKPGICVVKKSNALPLNRNDGITVCTIEGSLLKSGRVSLSIPDSITARKTYYKLFFEKDSDYESYKLVASDVKPILN